jgi:tRNA (mo5U34)-methyltransferase
VSELTSRAILVPVMDVGAQVDEDRIAATGWFHSIDFGEFASSGRFEPGEPQNVTLFGVMDLIRHIDLRGVDVLDIGTMDGLMAFGTRMLGARRVVATDSFRRDSFELARSALGLDVDYVPGVQLDQLSRRFGPGEFDLVICAGVIYHMLNPASAFFECRKLIKENGLLVIESTYEPAENRAAIFVNSEAELSVEPHTYSIPTRSAVFGLMRLALFDLVAVRTLKSPPRVTVLGRAVSPDEVRDRSPLTRRIHELDFCDFTFQIAKVWPSPQSSSIAYTGDHDESTIDPKLYDPQFPLHPPRDRRTVGSTVWNTPLGER